ncbi:ABC transporter permease [Thalassotalea castellviae]|uniref:DUF4175 domain-containing protein n=1 Tax=Thalassotalea castellviae TaxID=3075612 RepID=A0ABU3A3Q1_9GAMM|nr:hypothetical protein [Thalassotalea sp. W431]MDT0604806.1 hypothetical protein [Thalassotalea sp. W431]
MSQENQTRLSTLIEAKLTKIRRYFIVNALSQFLPIAIIIGYIASIFLSKYFADHDPVNYINMPVSLVVSIVFTIFILLLKYFRITSSKAFKNINQTNFLIHCNRHFPSLEESAQLALSNKQELNVLQRLQQNKVVDELSLLLTQDEKLGQKEIKLNGHFHRFPSVVIAVVLCCSWWFFSPSHLVEYFSVEQPSLKTANPVKVKSNVAENKTVTLLASQVNITPPKYTGLLENTQQDLNVDLLTGSTVTWQLHFSNSEQSYFIEFEDGNVKPLLFAGNEQFTLSTVIEHTGLYKLYSQDKSFQQIYTLRVTLDKKPVIRILTPKNTITEVEKNGQTSLITQVNISDDYGVNHVEILASIAKGSGESVKFRDQVFSFDTVQKHPPTEANQFLATYDKTWNFEALGMKPGDELYFTVKAWDNKQPNRQLTSSETKIIRWLEDEEQLVMADGILIDFMPEYFKSQRQIIIETKALIADKKQLSEEDFVETSELLGVAQSELKQKYGQYLGDEFDEGGAGPVPNGAGFDEHHEGDEHDDESEHEQANNHQQAKALAASGHDHGVASQTEIAHSSDDKSGYSQLIETYAHNHEDTDIGMMSRQDPKALMKQSIANMWQAELYLMLSQPKKALPFEEQALTLLKMAKKAERIYVKRLGFEPPPVSDERRYQGDLSDINSENKEVNIELSQNEQSQMAQLYRVINHYLSDENSKKTTAGLLPEERVVIKAVKRSIQDQLDDRPVLIQEVATLERILLADSFLLANCQLCLENLKNKLWQLLDSPIALPNTRKLNYLYNSPLINQYNQLLMQEGERTHRENNVENTMKTKEVSQ